MDNVILLNRKITELTMDFQKLNYEKDSGSKCIQAGQNLYFLFRQQMKYVASQCTESCNILANIKCELEIANKSKRFDLVTIFEIDENAKKLLSNLEETQQKNENLKEEIRNIIKVVEEEKLAIDNKTCNSFTLSANRATFTGIVMECVLPTTAMVIGLCIRYGAYTEKITPSAIGCSWLAGFIVKVTADFQEIDCEAKSEPINNLLRKMYKLQKHSTYFSNFVARIIEELLNLTKSAEKNLAYRFISGDRVSLLTEKMIGEINSLQTCYLLVESKTTKFSRKYMLLNNN